MDLLFVYDLKENSTCVEDLLVKDRKSLFGEHHRTFICNNTSEKINNELIAFYRESVPLFSTIFKKHYLLYKLINNVWEKFFTFFFL